MSRENVTIVRRIWDAVESRDTDGVFAFYDQDITWQNHTGGALDLQDRAYHGHKGVRQFWREWMEPFESFDAHAETFIDAGDSVVVGWQARARGKASGADVEMPRWNVYEIRDGLVVGIDVFQTKSQALEAVGLSEQDAHADS
jgi:ketosteroid isomerase-like protein